ncbi:oligosaccharide flippase family protein [Sporosarcina psychrophila]|uniref:O-antigen/teichoic acid export membrane protein n=1 Tax=Sporosarcina psychrophila TaxID=1476 RepID=A0ABV2K360_SPOPS
MGKLFKNENAKAGGFYLFGNLFDKALAFLTIPIFTRLMSTSDYGLVNTYLSWVTILSVIVGLSLGSSIRSAYLDFKEELEEYISSIFFLSFLNFGITSAIIIIISYLFIEQVDLILVVLCLLQSFMIYIINSISIKYMMSMEYIKKTLILAIPNIIIGILSVVYLLNINSEYYFGRIIPFVIVATILGSYFLIKAFIKGRKFINKLYWKYALGLSIPLVFHGLSINILSTADRTMITTYHSTSETGIYSLAYSFSMIAMVVIASLESVWIPWFNKKLQNGERDVINKNVKLYIEVIVIVMIVILMVGPEVLEILAPEEYWSGKVLIGPILLASFFIFLYSISVNLEYYYKSTKIIAVNTIIAAFVNISLNFIFIPIYGAIGAAFTTVFAYVVSFGIHYYAARKLDNQLFPFEIYIKPVIIMLFFVTLSYVILDYAVYRWVIAIIGFSLYILISLKKNRFKVLLNPEM